MVTVRLAALPDFDPSGEGDEETKLSGWMRVTCFAMLFVGVSTYAILQLLVIRSVLKVLRVAAGD